MMHECEARHDQLKATDGHQLLDLRFSSRWTRAEVVQRIWSSTLWSGAELKTRQILLTEGWKSHFLWLEFMLHHADMVSFVNPVSSWDPGVEKWVHVQQVDREEQDQLVSTHMFITTRRCGWERTWGDGNKWRASSSHLLPGSSSSLWLHSGLETANSRTFSSNESSRSHTCSQVRWYDGNQSRDSAMCQSGSRHCRLPSSPWPAGSSCSCCMACLQSSRYRRSSGCVSSACCSATWSFTDASPTHASSCLEPHTSHVSHFQVPVCLKRSELLCDCSLKAQREDVSRGGCRMTGCQSNTLHHICKSALLGETIHNTRIISLKTCNRRFMHLYAANRREWISCLRLDFVKLLQYIALVVNNWASKLA